MSSIPFIVQARWKWGKKMGNFNSTVFEVERAHAEKEATGDKRRGFMRRGFIGGGMLAQWESFDRCGE